jgi:hypothetical protein
MHGTIFYAKSKAHTTPVRMASLWSVLRWDLYATLRWWHLGATLLLFGFTGRHAAVQAARVAQAYGQQLPVSVWDACVLAFAGPGLTDTSPLAMLTWFVPHMLFFYLIGDMVYGELVQRGCAVVPSVGSRRRWWWGKVMTLALLAVGYAVLGVGAVLASALTTLPWSSVWEGGVLALLNASASPPPTISVATLLPWVLWLFAGTLFMAALWQTTLALLFRRSLYGLVAVVMVMLVSWLLGTDNPGLVRWLPGSQSMLLRHTLFEPAVRQFTFQWSLLYNAALALVAIGVGRWYVARMDIFGRPLTERH